MNLLSGKYQHERVYKLVFILAKWHVHICQEKHTRCCCSDVHEHANTLLEMSQNRIASLTEETVKILKKTENKIIKLTIVFRNEYWPLNNGVNY